MALKGTVKWDTRQLLIQLYRGAGLAEALRVEEHIDLHVGTLSKAVGAQGGFIACSHAIRNVLLTKSRSFVYSTGLALPIVAAVQAAIDTAERVCCAPTIVMHP